MFLKAMDHRTYDLRKFGCVMYNNTTVSICVDPSQTIFDVAVLDSEADAKVVYDGIIKAWAYGEEIFDIAIWLANYHAHDVYSKK